MMPESSRKLIETYANSQDTLPLTVRDLERIWQVGRMDGMIEMLESNIVRKKK